MTTYLNIITLAGVVNSLKTTELANNVFAYRFVITVAEVYKSKDGTTMTNVDYFPVSYFSSTPGEFKEGDNIKVEGRLKCEKFVSDTSDSRCYYQVTAHKITVL